MYFNSAVEINRLDVDTRLN